MTEDLMVGTIGWDHDNWVESFYPDDLPEDWRFSLYSNEYRAVLATADHLQPDDLVNIVEWAEDCDDAFRFIVEVPEPLIRDSDTEPLKSFLTELSPLGTRVAGFLVSLGDMGDEEIDPLQGKINLLQLVGPVCIDQTGQSEAPVALLNLIRDSNIGLCWHPERGDAPAEGGSLLLALSNEGDAKGQRRLIESLQAWTQKTNGRAGLFLESPDAASQARIIAEMLGV